MKSLWNDIMLRMRRWFGIIETSVLFDYTNLISIAGRRLSTSSEKNEFHLKVLDFLNRLICGNEGNDLLFHLRKKGLNWDRCDDDQPIQILATGQLQKLADEHDIYQINGDLELIKDLAGNAKQPYTYGILFQLFDYYDYLLLTSKKPENGKEVFQLVSAMVKEVKSRVALNESYSGLQKKMDRLEKNLIIKENDLRKSEKALKKRVYEIHNLLEISNELYSILNLKRLINSALLIILGQVGCQRAFAILYDAVDRKFSKKYVKGFEEEELEEFILDVDHPVINYFSRIQRPVLVEELLGEDGTKSMAEYLLERNVEVIAPIFHSERVRGILGCGDQLYNQTFDQSENDIFNILVNIISISVFNAQTFEEIRTLALTDAMTNLHNYRYFEDRLKEEINRARRNGSCVSIIMLDIDHFKNYNDTLGHQAGDEALRTLGWILKNTVREEDIVNRYGGEEFCIILPGLEKKVISILGNRIREKVEEFPFLKQNVQPGGTLTVSLGCATFPEDADDFEDLVYKADQALYQSKNSGRNRLTIYNYSN